MTCPPGDPRMTTFVCGKSKASGEQALVALRKLTGGQKQGRDEEPSAAVIDSQSIKTSAVRGSEKGIDMGKKIWGRKRHALVDTQGNLLSVKVTAASDSDLAGAKQLLAPLKGLFPRLKLFWGESHYWGMLIEWVKEHLGCNIQIVRRLLSQMPLSRNPEQKRRLPGRASCTSSQKMGGRENLRLDHPLASALSRS